jgi:hypothetical protein
MAMKKTISDDDDDDDDDLEHPQHKTQAQSTSFK